VETFIVKDIRKQEYLKDFSEVYLIGRKIYNRGPYGHYELVTVKRAVNHENKKVVSIVTKMLQDDEVKLFTTPKFSRESAFHSSLTVYTLTETSQHQTELNYEYLANTNHWLLNKEVTVSQVFSSMSKSIKELLDSIELEAAFLKKELASKK
jgi:hypothetical protein